MSDTPVATVDVTDDAINSAMAPDAESQADVVETSPDSGEGVDAGERETLEADGEATDAATGTAEPPAPTYEPFSFNAFKQPYEVPGLQFDRQSLTIKAESPQAIDRMRQMLAQGREWEARGRQELVALRKENTTLKQTREDDPDKVAAQAYLAEWRAMMEMPEEQLAAFLQQARMEWPRIEARAERAVAERLRQQAQQLQQPPEPDVETIVTEAQQGAAALVQELLQDQPWANPEIAQEVTEYLQDIGTMDQWVLRANRDLPDYGIRAGQYVANWDQARTIAERLLRPYRRAFEQTTTVKQQAAQTTKIAAQNAATLASSKPKVAPKPATPARPAAAKTQTTPSDARGQMLRDVWATWREVNGQ